MFVLSDGLDLNALPGVLNLGSASERFCWFHGFIFVIHARAIETPALQVNRTPSTQPCKVIR